MARDPKDQSRSEAAHLLLQQIEQSRRDFERETQSRRRLLQDILEEMEKGRRELDPLIDDIERQWCQLNIHYYEVSRRYQRRFKKPPRRTVPPVPVDPHDWRAYHWQLDENHKPISNLHNATAALREAPELSGILALDQSQNAIVLKGPLPFAHWESLDFEMRRLKDADLSALLEYLHKIGLALLSREDCLAAVRLIAAENAWRPADE